MLFTKLYFIILQTINVLEDHFANNQIFHLFFVSKTIFLGPRSLWLTKNYFFEEEFYQTIFEDQFFMEATMILDT
jgi:hypothetical protein